MDDRRELRNRVIEALQRYRHGRFTVNGSGGANGMIFFIDDEGREWFIGGMHGDHANRVVRALNGILRLIELQRSRMLACN